MARFISSTTAREQIGWITGAEPKDDNVAYKYVPLKKLDQLFGLFSTPDHASLYEIKARSMAAKFSVPSSCTGLLANALLYNVDQGCAEHLKEPERIRCIFVEAVQVLKTGIKAAGTIRSFPNLNPMVQELSSLKSLFGRCSFAEAKDSTPPHLTLRFTNTEDLCLKTNFKKVNYSLIFTLYFTMT